MVKRITLLIVLQLSTLAGGAPEPVRLFDLSVSSSDSPHVALRLGARISRERPVRPRPSDFVCIFSLLAAEAAVAAESAPFVLSLVPEDIFVSLGPLDDWRYIPQNLPVPPSS
jgi:hypothetical protein